MTEFLRGDGGGYLLLAFGSALIGAASWLITIGSIAVGVVVILVALLNMAMIVNEHHDVRYAEPTRMETVMTEPQNTVNEGAARDLDETRRLLYMALVANRTSKGELVATLTNALAHHNLKLDADEVMTRLIGAIDDQQESDQAWVRQQIDALTDKLDES